MSLPLPPSQLRLWDGKQNKRSGKVCRMSHVITTAAFSAASGWWRTGKPNLGSYNHVFILHSRNNSQVRRFKNERMPPSLDRISLLPDCILELILVLLPLPEVVRTSCLSRRWGLLWTQIPKLVFDKSFFKSVRDKTKLMPVICGIISRRRRPLLDFTFSLSGLSCLDIGWTGKFGNGYFKLDNEPYELLSLGELSLLKRLRFESCECTVPGGFGGFPMLTNLSFCNVNINTDDLCYIIKSSPLLDTLSIVDIPLCFFVDIVAPNLRVFYCKAILMSLYFEFTPRLEKLMVSLDDSISDKSEEIVLPFGSIPEIQYMELNGCFLKYMIRGDDQKVDGCKNDMKRLSCVKLDDVNFNEENVGQNIISLIKHAPNLKTIFISASSWLPSLEPRIGDWPIGDLSDLSLNELRYVTMEDIKGHESELEFIAMLLAKSPMLESMKILLHHELTDEEGLRVGEKFGGFEHASSQLSIKFYKAPSNNYVH